MKRNIRAAALVGLSIVLMTSTVFASTVFGKIQRFSVTTEDHVIRVAILMEGNTSCPQNGWFVYKPEDSNVLFPGLSRLQTDLLLAAYQSDGSVLIRGTGVCDVEGPLGTEGIAYLEIR